MSGQRPGNVWQTFKASISKIVDDLRLLYTKRPWNYLSKILHTTTRLNLRASSTDDADSYKQPGFNDLLD
jgi:hypothetical protein